MNAISRVALFSVTFCCLIAVSTTSAQAQVYAPVTTYYAPVPVTSYYAPTPAYYSPAPVTTYYAPSPAYYGPTPVTTYYAPGPVYAAPAPVYAAPAYFPGRYVVRYRRW